MFRRVLASLAVIGLLACGGGGGGKVDPAWAAYQAAAQKILNDYDLAMTDVATIDAALVDLGGGPPKITTDTAVQQLETVVVPKLGRCAKAAADLQTPDYPVLTEAHRPLTTGLAGKVEGYKQMLEAYKKRDSAQFDTALKVLLASDAIVKRYRADFQRWSEDGRVTISAAAPPPTQAPKPTEAVPGVPSLSIPGVKPPVP